MQRRRLVSLIALAWAAPLAARAAGGGGEKKVAGGESYIALKMLTGVTVRTDGSRGVLTVEGGLDIPDARLRHHAELVLPRLRAAYAQAVQTYAAALPTGFPPDVELISRTLQRETDKVVGRPGARFLLGAVLIN
jgi:hypothetical protein